jgi:hypothetical protein
MIHYNLIQCIIWDDMICYMWYVICEYIWYMIEHDEQCCKKQQWVCDIRYDII